MKSVALAVYLVLSVAHTWPLARHLGSHLRGLGDSVLNVWVLGAVAQRLVSNPLRLFDVNMYYPWE